MKVSVETARKEVKDLIELKKMRPNKAARMQGVVEQLVEAVTLGDVVFDLPNGKITQKLAFPLGENKTVTELVYDIRIPVRRLNEAYVRLGGVDGQAKINACIEVLTNIFATQVLDLEPTDKELADYIAVFFT